MAGDDDDPDALFRAAMKNTKPLKGRRARPMQQRSAKRADPLPERVPPRAGTRSPAPPPPLDPAAASGLDRATADRLRRGKLEPEARLDLHGLTVAQAERALARFLERAQGAGCKMVLVITGKGLREASRQGAGRIRGEFPHWLNRPENRARVHGVRTAHARHGGSGAFYLMVRRPR